MQEDRHVPTHSKTALAALAFVLVCAPAFAQGDPPDDSPAAPDSAGPGGMHRPGPGRDGGGFGRGGREGREFMLGRLLSDPAIREQLRVSADQAAKIRQQEADFRKTAIRSRADLQIKQIDLREMMAADKPDRPAIDAKLQEISTARLAFEKSAVHLRLDWRDALTPDQRQKLRDLTRNRRGRDGGPGEHGPRGGWQGGRRGNAPPPKQSGPPPAPAGP
jgi:Spy/CpxP family protein refolding chaperone